MKNFPWPTVIMFLIILIATAYIANSFSQQPIPDTQNIVVEEGTIEESDDPAPPAIRKQCPEMLIINKMPQVSESGEPVEDNRYYILDGKTYRPDQLDEEWIKRNCNVPTEEVY